MNNKLKWFKVHYGIKICVNRVLENYKSEMSYLLLCGTLLWQNGVAGSLPENDQYLMF